MFFGVTIIKCLNKQLFTHTHDFCSLRKWRIEKSKQNESNHVTRKVDKGIFAFSFSFWFLAISEFRSWINSVLLVFFTYNFRFPFRNTYTCFFLHVFLLFFACCCCRFKKQVFRLFVCYTVIESLKFLLLLLFCHELFRFSVHIRAGIEWSKTKKKKTQLKIQQQWYEK